MFRVIVIKMGATDTGNKMEQSDGEVVYQLS